MKFKISNVAKKKILDSAIHFFWQRTLFYINSITGLEIIVYLSKLIFIYALLILKIHFYIPHIAQLGFPAKTISCNNLLFAFVCFFRQSFMFFFAKFSQFFTIQIKTKFCGKGKIFRILRERMKCKKNFRETIYSFR